MRDVANTRNFLSGITAKEFNQETLGSSFRFYRLVDMAKAKPPRLTEKLRAMMDWTLDFLFG
jgi:hypothetical protein